MKKVVIFLLLTVIYPGYASILAQESMGSIDQEKIKEEVWEVVKKRNSTWPLTMVLNGKLRFSDIYLKVNDQ